MGQQWMDSDSVLHGALINHLISVQSLKIHSPYLMHLAAKQTFLSQQNSLHLLQKNPER